MERWINLPRDDLEIADAELEKVLDCGGGE